MEYKRSKSLYLSILAGMALIAGVAHTQPSSDEIRVSIYAPEVSSQTMQVVKVDRPVNTITNDQNTTNNEEADHNARVILD